MQNDTIIFLPPTQQAQLKHVNDSLMDYIPLYYGTTNKHFEWILKLETIAAVIK